MEAATDNNSKKRGVSNGNRSGREWTEIAVDTCIAALAIAGSAFVSGLAAAAGASTFRTLTSSDTEHLASEGAAIVPLKKHG